jgi:hypothetical protein
MRAFSARRTPDLAVLLGTAVLAAVLAAAAILLPGSSTDDPSTVSQAPTTSSVALRDQCSTAYRPCVREAEDRDCNDIGFKVALTGYADPYDLDRDGDGFGCEAYPESLEGEADQRTPT